MNSHPMEPARDRDDSRDSDNRDVRDDRDGREAITHGDDPRLTAYALGELEGPEDAADRAEIEALLATDPVARQSLAEIRAVAGELADDLLAETAQPASVAGLTDVQRRALELALPQAGRNGVAHVVADGSVAEATPAVDDVAAVRRRSTSGYPHWLRFLPALAAAGFIAVLVWNDGAEPVRAPAGGAVPVARAGAERADKDASNGLRTLGYLESGKTGGVIPRAESDGPAVSPRSPSDAGAPATELPSAASGKSKSTVWFSAGDSSASRTTAGDAVASGETTDDLTRHGMSAGSPPIAALSPEMREQLTQLGYIESSGDAAGGAQAAPPPAALPRRAGSSAANGTLRTLGYLGAGYLGATDDEAAAPHLPADGRDRDQAYRYFRTAPGGEGYQPIVESGFQSPLTAPRSTFSVDVDTASYANVRRFLNAGQVPPADAVRLEELINYFRYDYPQPDGEHPFSVTTDVTACPWAASHRLVRIGLQGRTIPQAERAPSNLVFLVDVSGSMGSPDKLPLVAASLRLLVGRLDGRDRIALVTYAGAAGLVLDSTSCAEKEPILAALERLDAGGSTAGGAGIALAYQVASRHFLAGGTNRVILATDGDFNVGATSRQELQSLIERSAKSGVFLTVLGFGTGNLQDGTAELLADKGNGNYAYIDSLGEAQKVLVQQMGGTLVTIAKDVKLQVEFNPARVASYRLLGYENRALATRDFNDDRKDAGEIGAGHSVTALYEVVPVGAADAPALDALRYQTDAAAAAPAASAAPPALKDSPELLYVALRYKQPSSDSSVLLGQPLMDAVPAARSVQFAADGQFIAAVAEFGMLLRHGGNAGTASWDSVLALAEAGRGADKDGYRAEFVRLVGIAQSLLAPAGEPRR